MPYISDFAQRLELPVPQPVTIAQVKSFGCSPRADHVGGRVALTNGYSFSFDHGAVELYSSPRSYYNIHGRRRSQDFYGPLNLTQNEAVQIARQTVKKLGYDDTVFHSDLPPKVNRPPYDGKDHIPRYLVKWLDPEAPKTPEPRETLEVEVDASTGQIQMLGILTKNAQRPDPPVAVHPPVIANLAQSQPYGGGTRIYALGQTYSNAFLSAILPQLCDYAKRAGLDMKLPITPANLDASRSVIGMVEGDPNAFLYLQNGGRFVYSHGQVIAFNAADAVSLPGNRDKLPKTCYGPVNVSPAEALAMATNVLAKLGYTAQVPQLTKSPELVPPRKDGTNYLARYFASWRQRGQDLPLAEVEVDATTPRLKSIYIDDSAIKQIWRRPPRVDAPLRDIYQQAPHQPTGAPPPRPNAPATP
jgi:hypothetical protein